LRTIAEIQTQAQRSVGRDTPTIIDDLGDSVWEDSDRLRKWILRQATLGQEFLLSIRRE
jgi:hypothetical protein